MNFSPVHGTTQKEVRTFLLQMLSEAIDILGEVENDPDHVVHELRRSNKRIRGLLRLCKGMLPAESVKLVDKKVRDAARCFADARDAFVMTEVCSSLEQRIKDSEHQEAVHAVATELKKRHDEHITHLSLPKLAAEVGSHFGEVLGIVETWDWPTIYVDDLIDGLIAIYRKGQEEFRVARSTRDPDHFHQLRRRTKYLSFHAEWMGEKNPDLLDPLAENSTHLASVLGEHHDLAVFEEVMEELENEFAGAKILRQEARNRRRELEEEGLPLGKTVYSKKAEKWKPLLSS